jgi:diadenosine tetraphosphatase ApaH/serine/threonine PP2A family protein phosphatase
MRLAIFSDVHANSRPWALCSRPIEEAIDVYYCLGDTVGYGGSPNECADLVRELAKTTILGNHDAAVSGRMDYSYYYEAARHALDAHASMISAENMAWLKSLPYEHRLDEIGVLLCHGSPVRLEEFEYIFAPEQARECLGIYDRARPHHAHRPLAPVQGLRAHADDGVEELPERRLRARARQEVHRLGRLGRPAARLRQPRELHGVRHGQKRFEFKRIEYDIELAADKVLRARLERNFAHRLFIGV